MKCFIKRTYLIQWCQPCHVLISLEIWHRLQWFRAEEEVLGSLQIRRSFSICSSILYVGGEVTIQGRQLQWMFYMYHLEFFLYIFFNCIIVKCPILLCMCWGFSICFLGGLLKTKSVPGELDVCVSKLDMYEWFCLLFGCFPPEVWNFNQ